MLRPRPADVTRRRARPAARVGIATAAALAMTAAVATAVTGPVEFAVAPAAAEPGTSADDDRARGPTPRGKIVRVERPRGGKVTLRVCPMADLDALHGGCYGGGPAVGDTAALFDERGYVGRIRATRVIATSDGCSAMSEHRFTFEWLERVQRRRGETYVMAVFGLTKRANQGRMIRDVSGVRTPSGRTDERVWMGLDSTGDREMDILATAHECTDTAPPPPDGGQATGIHCIDYWRRARVGWDHVRRDYLYSCF